MQMLSNTQLSGLYISACFKKLFVCVFIKCTGNKDGGVNDCVTEVNIST